MRARVRIAMLAGFALAVLFAPSQAAGVGLQSIGPSFDEPVFATSPPGDPRLFVVERPGYIQVLHDGTVSQFLDIHTQTTMDGERGFLSMAFDPNYASNGLFYVFYTGAGDGGLGHVDEIRVNPGNPNVANPASQRSVLTISRPSAFASNHNGGQLQFGKDGYLYVSVGDGGTGGSTAQDLGVWNGKILRVDPHGSAPGQFGVPPNNPFGAVWSLGFRNPFRFSFDHLTGDLVVGDVGEVSREEIDFSPASSGGGRGANYGWPCREGFSAGPGGCGGSFVNPVFDYPHDDPGGDVAHGCAIIGGYVYRGTQAPEIAGRYLYADLCTAELRSIQLGIPLASGDRAESAEGALGSARSFGQDSACNLYVMNTSTVFRIVGSASSVVPACPATPVKSCCPQGKKGKKCKKRKHKKRAAESKHKKQKHKKCKKKRKKKHRR
jgi:glucose/arabinose dehydrogenase